MPHIHPDADHKPQTRSQSPKFSSAQIPVPQTQCRTLCPKSNSHQLPGSRLDASWILAPQIQLSLDPGAPNHIQTGFRCPKPDSNQILVPQIQLKPDPSTVNTIQAIPQPPKSAQHHPGLPTRITPAPLPPDSSPRVLLLGWGPGRGCVPVACCFLSMG